MPSEVVAAQGVWKRYGKRDVLRDVGFSLRTGEAVGYLGPNGAGKTTTLKLLTGLSRPTRGSVRVFGLDPDRDRGRALGRLGVLVETPGLPPYLTGGDLLEYVGRVRGVAAAARPAAVRAAADGAGVRDHIDRPYGSLSTGLARRMLLAAVLVGEPECLLLDEPTLGLDPVARHDLRALLRTLSRKGVTLLLSTHLLEDVEEVCDRVLFLRNGRVVGDEPVHLAAGTDPTARRTVRLRFAADVSVEAVRRAAGPSSEVALDGPRSASVGFVGGEPEQAEVLAAVVRAGLPLLTAAAPESDLARRYIERVGREDDS